MCHDYIMQPRVIGHKNISRQRDFCPFSPLYAQVYCKRYQIPSINCRFNWLREADFLNREIIQIALFFAQIGPKRASGEKNDCSLFLPVVISSTRKKRSEVNHYVKTLPCFQQRTDERKQPLPLSPRHSSPLERQSPETQDRPRRWFSRYGQAQRSCHPYPEQER